MLIEGINKFLLLVAVILFCTFAVNSAVRDVELKPPGISQDDPLWHCAELSDSALFDKFVRTSVNCDLSLKVDQKTPVKCTFCHALPTVFNRKRRRKRRKRRRQRRALESNTGLKPQGKGESKHTLKKAKRDGNAKKQQKKGGEPSTTMGGAEGMPSANRSPQSRNTKMPTGRSQQSPSPQQPPPRKKRKTSNGSSPQVGSSSLPTNMPGSSQQPQSSQQPPPRKKRKTSSGSSSLPSSLGISSMGEMGGSNMGEMGGSNMMGGGFPGL